MTWSVFFSILRSTVGVHFTTKNVMYEWRKICQEFSRRLDPDLPYYYYTTSHDRFFECDWDNFDVVRPSKSNPRNRRINKQEQPGNLVIGRATCIRPGPKSTIRRQFHMQPIDVPPPPGASLDQVVAAEHSY